MAKNQNRPTLVKNQCCVRTQIRVLDPGVLNWGIKNLTWLNFKKNKKVDVNYFFGWTANQSSIVGKIGVKLKTFYFAHFSWTKNSSGLLSVWVFQPGSSIRFLGLCALLVHNWYFEYLCHFQPRCKNLFSLVLFHHVCYMIWGTLSLVVLVNCKLNLKISNTKFCFIFKIKSENEVIHNFFYTQE